MREASDTWNRKRSHALHSNDSTIQLAASIEHIAIVGQKLQLKQTNAGVINYSGLSHLVG